MLKTKHFVAILILFSMTISIVGVAQVSHLCKMEMFMEEDCGDSMNCCNDEDQDISCCSTEIDFYQANLSPLLSETNNYSTILKKIDHVELGFLSANKQLGLASYKIWRNAHENFVSSSSPPKTIQYSIFLI